VQTATRQHVTNLRGSVADGFGGAIRLIIWKFLETSAS
jgi:hypothetical protein